MAGTTYKWVSEQRLLYFTQKLKQHIPELTDLIDDAVAASDKTYSSNKIDTLLGDKVDVVSGKGLSTNDFDDAYKKLLDDWDLTGIIDDNAGATVDDKTYSAKKILALLGEMTGVKFKKVASFEDLPAVGESSVIYLVPNSGTNPNVYDEYVFLFDEGSTTSGSYEKIGTTEIDLSGYVEHTDMVEITTTEIDNIMTTVFGATPPVTE